MGDVCRARDTDLQRDVAIKFLRSRLASNPDRLARFAQEARTASSLNHPNILTIQEIGEVTAARSRQGACRRRDAAAGAPGQTGWPGGTPSRLGGGRAAAAT